MEAFVHFANQTQGRERLFRATQYSCMLLSYMLEHKAGQEKLVTKLKDLESSMSSGRKLFRLGNTVHAIVAAKKAAQLPDVVPCICLTVANLNRALFFICDTILWVRSVGLVKHIDKKKWRQRATKCYYYSLVVSLAKDLYELSWRMEKMAQAGKAKQDVPPCGQQLQSMASLALRGLLSFLLLLCLTLWNYPPLSLDLLKNICDLSSPLDRLGIYKTNPGVIGLCGLISSVVGIFTVAMPGLRLNP
ncbi:Peroxisomal membrane protein 11A [Varanus komodoensis]|uniref:peroxisomal membrane protein 11A isoform X2 n=1 Tax=Varanus komodoensis TaxID=61221 RepID=UPI001CF781CE|nr:peroxisomal membrane protein 11A isoform X2 [Varanus komodoensis]KAF7241535.1 Peroxisomal membrane protein 11A [Varanus komodoensis]